MLRTKPQTPTGHTATYLYIKIEAKLTPCSIFDEGTATNHQLWSHVVHKSKAVTDIELRAVNKSIMGI